MNINRCKGHPAVQHVDCGGQLAISGEGYIDVPHGLGFDDTTRLVADTIRYPSYSGFCMGCQTKGLFVRIDKQSRKLCESYSLEGVSVS